METLRCAEALVLEEGGAVVDSVVFSTNSNSFLLLLVRHLLLLAWHLLVVASFKELPKVFHQILRSSHSSLSSCGMKPESRLNAL